MTGPAARSGTLLSRTTALLERRLPRRSVLARAAVVASAATIAPIRYLTRPVSAAAVIGCGSCTGGSLCCSGYTAFCCQLHDGDNFGCPSYAFVGGWWQCNYGGEGLCGNTNVRYYLDCNRRHYHSCPEGCHCAQNECSLRKTCCVTFRYGQCNTHIGGPTTQIVCRLVTCLPPCQIDCLNCNCSSARDQYTCRHEASCL